MPGSSVINSLTPESLELERRVIIVVIALYSVIVGGYIGRIFLSSHGRWKQRSLSSVEINMLHSR